LREIIFPGLKSRKKSVEHRGMVEKAESEKNMGTYFLWNGGVRVVISNEIWKIDLLWDIGRFSVVVTPASLGYAV